jgi:hypothetical protein
MVVEGMVEVVEDTRLWWCSHGARRRARRTWAWRQVLWWRRRLCLYAFAVGGGLLRLRILT